MKQWYEIINADQIDSPALLLYPERIQKNINLAIRIAGSADRLRPHVKTNKILEVCRMMLDAGITRFKCATIAEAEMLGMAGAPDVLLAYQPVGPKLQRFLTLAAAYPKTSFSCLVDNELTAGEISQIATERETVQSVFIDLNVGMNRTGILPEKAVRLAEKLTKLPGIRLSGLHAYDGHIHDNDPVIRREQADESYRLARMVLDWISTFSSHSLELVIGGTPSFTAHANRQDCICSPGTFVFWDWGYRHMLSEQPFEYAALLLTRVVSVIDNTHICVDLGYKAVAAESPLPRVHFLNAPDAVPVAHSEEHLVLEVPDSSTYPPGTILYGVPVHICPTVALYDKARIVTGDLHTKNWEVIARKREILY